MKSFMSSSALTIVFLLPNLGNAQIAVAAKDSPEIRTINSRLFGTYADFMSVNDRVGLAKNLDKKDINVIREIKPEGAGGTPTKFEEPALASELANSDLVIIGYPQHRESELTQEGSFVFSDYSVWISTIYKNDKKYQILPGSSIVITRAGGMVDIKGKKIHGIVPGFPLFRLGGQYIMCLRYIPESGSFLLPPGGSFWIDDNNVVNPSVGLSSVTAKDKTVFINKLNEILGAIRSGGAK